MAEIGKRSISMVNTAISYGGTCTERVEIDSRSIANFSMASVTIVGAWISFHDYTSTPDAEIDVQLWWSLHGGLITFNTSDCTSIPPIEMAGFLQQSQLELFSCTKVK
jgi:hypothetical protein